MVEISSSGSGEGPGRKAGPTLPVGERGVRDLASLARRLLLVLARSDFAVQPA